MKNLKIITIIFTIVLLYTSCKSYYYTSEQAIRPKKMKFKLAKKDFSLKDDKIIDTNSVYVTEILFDNNVKYFVFLRFFKNGRVFLSYEYKQIPTNENFNNVKFGSVGYYTLYGNELKYEIYGKLFDTAKYHTYYAFIKNDTIINTNIKIGKGLLKNKSNTIFIRHRAILNSKSDW